jgi:hypothetical protein
LEKILTLKNKIGELKNNVNINLDELFRHEKILDDVVDSIMRAELEKNSLFKILNAEKNMPHFVKMTKIGKGSESLSNIKDDNGIAFDDDNLRKNHIKDFYRKLYTKPVDSPPLNENTIRDFLGEEICDSSIVKNSKLTPDEKNMLITNFSVDELDEAMKEARSATASGPDGIGNTCFKKVWNYIRVPLTNYANCCVEKGTLTDNFRTASIKLIPKKGDISSINNWRPISLLNCSYKIISKAINSRLKKIANRILSRAQKGFTDGKYIQECLINIIETIARCNKAEVLAFVLAINQAKAFDSVRHDFMRLCLEFFEVPESFIRILEVFTMNRTACIAFDDGTESTKFDLEIGNTQGNGPSPLQFNFCEQILFFKIELDPHIGSVFCNNNNFPVSLQTRPLKNFMADQRDHFFL